LTNFSKKIPHWSFYRFSFFVFTAVFILTFLIPQYVYHQVWIVLVFFFLLTLASLIVIEKVTRKNAKNFLAIYFSAMIARLFISIIFATIFILTDRSHVFNFAINFLFLYLLFLGFEIYGIITNLRHQFKKGSRDE
jgi:hypothetical protein